jgi:hypothetical protein
MLRRQIAQTRAAAAEVAGLLKAHEAEEKIAVLEGSAGLGVGVCGLGLGVGVCGLWFVIWGLWFERQP